MNAKAKHLRNPMPLRARWITVADTEDTRNAYVLFRREFDVDDDPTDLTLRISADTRYRAYLNGRRIAEGPPPSMPHHAFFDVWDIAPFARAGTNCLAVVVHHLRHADRDRLGLLAEVLAGGGKALTITSHEWRCRRADAWWTGGYRFRMNVYDPFQEFFDARKMPEGWARPGFDDSAWPTAAELIDADWRLYPRDIPEMAEELRRPARIERVEECTWLNNRTRWEDLSICLSQVGRPVEHARVENADGLVTGAAPAGVQCSTEHRGDPTFDGVRDPCLVLDFGRVLTAYVELELECPAGGGSVDIGVAERLIDGHFNNAIEGMFATRYTLKPGRQTFRTFAWRGFRYVKLRFRECFEPVTVHAARAAVTTYPFEQRGAFACDDERLNAVFDISRHTLRLCSHESIMDTPWREQAQWLGDVAGVTLGGIYACFGDTALPGKFLRQSASTRRPDGLLQNITNRHSPPDARCIPDYSLWWIMGLWNHYRYTGERRWIDDHRDTVRGIAEAFLARVDAHGLACDVPGWVFIDWAHVDKRGECTPLNALLAAALDDAAKMARIAEDIPAAERYEAAAAGIRRAAVDRLFDERRGVFADARVGEELSERASEHANAAAVRWGLCDDELAERIVRRIYVDRSVSVTECQPFFTTVVLAALTRIGRADLAVEVVRDRWGRRMVDRGATSTFEEWGCNGSWRDGEYKGFLRTLSHAWSACPAEFLIKTLAGIEILQPGCGSLRVDPPPAGLDFRAVFPTPLGNVRVEHRAGETAVTAPDAVEIVPAR